ncbi:MAG: hypothetical protein GY820_39265 [Gammaproteobacteria bacterium]|nr:hypothetical protein [Gammaproteobacteria bacterium]
MNRRDFVIAISVLALSGCSVNFAEIQTFTTERLAETSESDQAERLVNQQLRFFNHPDRKTVKESISKIKDFIEYLEIYSSLGSVGVDETQELVPVYLEAKEAYRRIYAVIEQDKYWEKISRKDRSRLIGLAIDVHTFNGKIIFRYSEYRSDLEAQEALKRYMGALGKITKFMMVFL